jgi:phosphoadenosine phosphosulfate reductase
MIMNQERQVLTSLSLAEKIDYSKEIIKHALGTYWTDDIWLAWTGGKDSTTMLWLFRKVCRELGQPLPRALFIDDGDVFDQIIELVNRVKDDWSVDVSFVKNTDVSDKINKVDDLIKVTDLNERNQREIKKLGFTKESFPFDPESYVGNHLMKTVALNVFIERHGIKALSTAIRWDEQKARVEEGYFSARKDPDHTRIHPILHFSERDIWNTIHKNNIPFCSLYREGYRSLGAKCSTIKKSDIPPWEQDLENSPERAGRGQDKEEIMAQLRALGYM